MQGSRLIVKPAVSVVDRGSIHILVNSNWQEGSGAVWEEGNGGDGGGGGGGGRICKARRPGYRIWHGYGIL